jgi:hypothetical protein
VSAGAREVTGREGVWRVSRSMCDLCATPLRSWRPEAKGRGRLGHGPGRLWPCPRRPRVRGVEERSREGDGSVEGRHRRQTSSRRCREVHASARPLQASDPRCMKLAFLWHGQLCSAFSTLESGAGAGVTSRPPGRDLGPRCSLLRHDRSFEHRWRIFAGGRGSRASLSGRTITEVRLRAGFCHTPGARRSPTKPPRPGRLVAATACPGRHETPGMQLGRPHRSRTRPQPAQPPALPAGTCCVMQWMFPPPSRISRAGTPTMSRSGKVAARIAAASSSRDGSSSG